MNNKPYILISGATSDIGNSVAQTLCPDYPLILHGRNIDRLEEQKKKIMSPNPVELWCADLAKVENLKSSLKEFLASKHILVGGFIHCAGMLKILPFKNFRDDYIKEIFDVNLFSAITILQTLLQKSNIAVLRRIIFISSMSSIRGDKGNTIYASTKGAIDALVRSLAMELAPDINVNAILPGWIHTQMTDSMYNNPEQMTAIDAKYPIGRGECKDIALMVQYLLGEGGRWVTAQCICVDGGASRK